ncbi:predicted protein [Coccidioides posadasii str. Silveira]|uniref:Predicted protein n=2 Tax=Coccidioides posadasii TaxID=199306 RepID=E9CWE1_COCPS|nr:predicted protein [Coccidioides posadasii str. Silveira]KMM65090.1 hypothetical protein CPAG_01442 [Coccidioides posadasii RMSCC 3488]
MPPPPKKKNPPQSLHGVLGTCRWEKRALDPACLVDFKRGRESSTEYEPVELVNVLVGNSLTFEGLNGSPGCSALARPEVSFNHCGIAPLGPAAEVTSDPCTNRRASSNSEIMSHTRTYR